MHLFGILHNIFIKCFFSHNDFKQKRTHNATSINAIYNNFICYTLSISSTPSKSSTPTRLNSYKHRIGREDDPQCKDCGFNNQDVNHLFDCPAHPTVMSPTKLWSLPADTIGEFAYLDPERLD